MDDFLKTYLLLCLMSLVGNTLAAQSVSQDPSIIEQVLYFENKDSLYVIEFEECFSFEEKSHITIERYGCAEKIETWRLPFSLRDSLPCITKAGIELNAEYTIFKYEDWDKKEEKSNKFTIIGKEINPKFATGCEGARSAEIRRLISEKLKERGYPHEFDENGELSDSFKSAYSKYQSEYMVKLCYWDVYQEFDLDWGELSRVFCNCMRE